jgi:hypothetical protein
MSWNPRRSRRWFRRRLQRRGHDRRPYSGGSSTVSWCSCTTFVYAPQGRGLRGCHQQGNGGGLGAPPLYTPSDISVSEALSTAHQALSQAQRVLCREGEDLTVERHRLQLWASMLK